MNPLIYDILLKVELILWPLIFILLFFITAPYGRFDRKGWGPHIPSRSAWMLMELPSLVLPLFFVFSFSLHRGSLIFLVIWMSHYFHRTVIYPFRISDPQKPFSLLIMVWGFLFNFINSYVNFYFITILRDPFSTGWFIQWKFILGLVLFVSGFIINKQSDAILKKLRSDGSKGYSIPQGGLYRWISSPNYLGEIIVWGGWAIMTWSLAGSAFFLFTIANLFPRALKNHKWYKETFSDYPPERRAILPYLC